MSALDSVLAAAHAATSSSRSDAPRSDAPSTPRVSEVNLFRPSPANNTPRAVTPPRRLPHTLATARSGARLTTSQHNVASNTLGIKRSSKV